MESREPARHIAEALIRAIAHPHHRRPEVSQPSFTITFSREPGSGGLSVARVVGKRLGWPVYDNELLTQLAKELQVDVDRLENIDERPGNWLVECLNAFSAASTVSEVTYFRRLLKLILALGSEGQCVIVGRGASFILPVETTLRVRLVAALKDRIAFISRERGLDPAEAAHYVETTDRERTRFIKNHFHRDLTDPQHYDLLLNASRFSVEECADMVIGALHLLQSRKTPAKQGQASP